MQVGRPRCLSQASGSQAHLSDKSGRFGALQASPSSPGLSGTNGLLALGQDELSPVPGNLWSGGATSPDCGKAIQGKGGLGESSLQDIRERRLSKSLTGNSSLL